MSTRRQFVQWFPAAACGLAAIPEAWSQASLVDDKSPQAAALGYVADAAKADKARYKQFAAGQACSNCALYQGKATDAAAACPLFAGKQVAGKGWCSAYSRKG